MAKAIEVLVFEIEGRLFGLPSVFVREVLRAVALSPIPKAPLTVEGLLNMRGEVVTVIDFRYLMEFPARLIEPQDYLIALWVNNSVIAIRVDDAQELLTIHLDEEVKQETGNLTKPFAKPNRWLFSNETDSMIEFVAKSPTGVIHVINPEQLLIQSGAEEIVRTLSSTVAEVEQ